VAYPRSVSGTFAVTDVVLLWRWEECNAEVVHSSLLSRPFYRLALSDSVAESTAGSVL